jgi:hypothetical protein
MLSRILLRIVISSGCLIGSRGTTTHQGTMSRRHAIVESDNTSEGTKRATPFQIIT